jgi:hypothetical protein
MLSIELDERRRVNLSLASCMLYVACTVLSVILLAVSLDSWRSSAPFTSLIEGYNATGLWVVLWVAAGTSIVVNVFGVSACYKQMYPHRRHEYVVSMAFCTALTGGVVLAALACSIVCYLHVVHLDDEFKVGFNSVCALQGDF